MKQELAWGTAAAMAIVAAVGISSPGGKSETNASTDRQSGQTISKAKAPSKGPAETGALPQCAEIIPMLEHFFLREKITGPAACYPKEPTPTPLDPNFHTKFLIATFPDPLHTHFSLLFDRFVEALQQGAQDEKYEYDSSWLPWDTEEASFGSVKDQDEAEDRKEKREAQPGIILFRSSETPYQKALIVFIVGEEPTSGIHRAQFENAVAWIRALQQPGDERTSVAILGPTSSGAFPSLAESLAKLLDKTSGAKNLNGGRGFAVYSGSASSRLAGLGFAHTPGIDFRSFVHDDWTALDWLCRYFAPGEETLRNVAILSEDETAYGYSVAEENRSSQEKNPNAQATAIAQAPPEICREAMHIYYPRDISTLRAAYQNQSMFNWGSAQLSQDSVQRRSLPTDLADPSGRQHDTVRTYAGNQTPLGEEALLLGTIDVLRAHKIEYVVLRSSSTLDPLFLANFLQRNYPEARVVIFNSDLLFQRGQDAMALRGVMTLSTYPLFSWAREWTALPPYDSHAHRVFPENATEGTYIASRLLLQTLARASDEKLALSCELNDKDLAHREVFAPPLRCLASPSAAYAPMPDYAPPFWTDPNACQSKTSDPTCRPPMWLSVITRHGTFPLAVLNDRTLQAGATGTARPNADSRGQQRWPATPRSTKVFLVILCGLAVFHFLCCGFASFTAKPAFRAHFATAGRRHTGLVLIGSYLICLMALLMAWGCGMFSWVPGPPVHSLTVWTIVAFVIVVSGVAIPVNIARARKLNGDAPHGRWLRSRVTISLALFGLGVIAFFLLWLWPLKGALLLANRAFIYWRSMHLISGVSPVVPFLSLTAGIYVWVWYALHGLALFGPDRPRLPSVKLLEVNLPVRMNHRKDEPLPLTMFSQENVAKPAVRKATPLAWDHVVAIVVLFTGISVLMFGLGHGVPLRNLGATKGSTYGRIFCLCLAFYCAFLLSEAWQIWRTWSSARQLLVFLDRMALRRTLSALRGFSWGTVWKMSGNVLDVRYKLLSRQLECLNHLAISLRLAKESNPDEQEPPLAGIEASEQSVNLSRANGLQFARWYSENYNKPDASDLKTFEDFQIQVAATTGVVLTEIVLPLTRTEVHSLVQVDREEKCEEDRNGPPPSENELIRNGEELVCLTYLGFVQNLLGRIRTIVLGGVYLFIALCVAVASYPFDPRTLLSGILLILFIAFGGSVVFTYADMHRDATLSHITNTKPGELGSEFWFKVLGYGAAPLLGLITQVFPEWSGFLFSWLQPGLSSLK